MISDFLCVQQTYLCFTKKKKKAVNLFELQRKFGTVISFDKLLHSYL